MTCLTSPIAQYSIVTANYWTFTLTDGALRMLVVLHFHNLGYGAWDIALLFLFYEFFGVITNLIGGWLGAKIGLNRTMHLGLLLQIIALSLLLVPSSLLTIPWVMAAQALSGIAKDLNKMSAKSAIKQLLPKPTANNSQVKNSSSYNTRLYRWVAMLTGSKNALKGIGFFLGTLLLSLWGFKGAVLAMVIALIITGSTSIFLLKNNLGKAKNKPKFSQLFAKTADINYLAAARLFLFGARDIWFVVALPVYLTQQLNWQATSTGAFFALWIIGYGVVQSLAPYLTRISVTRLFTRLFTRFSTRTGINSSSSTQNDTHPQQLIPWAIVLTFIPAGILLSLKHFDAQWVLLIGLFLFGAVFALNSAMHSYLIVNFARADGTSLDVGFYYMANAMGRLIGTLLSGLLYQFYGLEACLIGSTLFLGSAAMLTMMLNRI